MFCQKNYKLNQNINWNVYYLVIGYRTIFFPKQIRFLCVFIWQCVIFITFFSFLKKKNTFKLLHLLDWIRFLFSINFKKWSHSRCKTSQSNCFRFAFLLIFLQQILLYLWRQPTSFWNCEQKLFFRIPKDPFEFLGVSPTIILLFLHC